MFNYWRSTSTELVALAPRVPYIGPKGAFDTDQDKWNTANSRNHPYIEYDGMQPPMRQPLDSGTAAGAMQEALSASDDMKAIMGARQPGRAVERISGRAIMADSGGRRLDFHYRQPEPGDAACRTDPADLIPKVYGTAWVIRVLGPDGTAKSVGVASRQWADRLGCAGWRRRRSAAGRYDLTVRSGPSFTSRRKRRRAR
jgi:hypothetical protein